MTPDEFSASRSYRLCGFSLLSFLWGSPRTKNLSAANPNADVHYGTMRPVSDVAVSSSTQYSRLPDEPPAKSVLNHSGHNDHGVTGSVVKKNALYTSSKRSKSRERVAFTPPAVSNLDKVQTATKSAQHGVLSPVAGMHGHNASASDSNASAAEIQRGKGALSQGEVKAAQKACNHSKSTFTGCSRVIQSAPVFDKSSMVPTAMPASRSIDSSAKADLLASAKAVPKGQTESTLSAQSNGPVTAESPPNPHPADTSAYLADFQSARSDPLSFLERHPMFHGRKAKVLSFDDIGSTPSRTVIRVKINGTVVSQSAAAGSDTRLAKARAAFKAIEALCVRAETADSELFLTCKAPFSFCRTLQLQAMKLLRHRSRLRKSIRDKLK